MAATIPNAPANLAVSAQTATALTIQWDAVSSADNGGDAVTDYRIYWDQGTSTWTQLATSTVGATTFTKDSGLSPGTTYKFKVSGVNSIGEGAQTTEFAVIAASVPDAPITLARDDSNTD